MSYRVVKTIKIDFFTLKLIDEFFDDEEKSEDEYNFVVEFDVSPKFKHKDIFSVYTYMNSMGYKTHNENIFVLNMVDFISSYFALLKNGVKHAAMENERLKRVDGEEDNLYA